MSLHNIFRSERNINIICILKRDIHLPLSIKYLPNTIRMKAKLLFMAFALCATFYSARVFSQEYQNGVFWIMFSQNEILARNETETTDERINNVFKRYDVYKLRQVFPYAKKEENRRIFEVMFNYPFIFPNLLKSQQVNHRKLRPAKSEELLSLKVYPNPTKGIFTIEYKLDDTAVKGYLRITDLKGSILGLKELTKNQDKLEMNIDKFPSGKYLIELWSEAGRIEGKIIVKM